MNKKLIAIIIAIVVVVAAVVVVIVAVNSGKDNENGGNGNQVTDTSVEGEAVEGTSLVVTNLEPSSLGARVTFVNAGDTMQNYRVKATFYDASGAEIATGSATAAAVEAGATKETPMIIDGDWENYDSVKYVVDEE